MTPPAPGPRVLGCGGVEIATYHFGGDGPPLMLAHATSFHAHCLQPVARVLARTFDVWGFDMRGHGASGRAPDGRYDDWDVFVEDLLAVLSAIDRGDWRGFGHSLGGAVMLRAERVHPGTFQSLCCYEPAANPPHTRTDEASKITSWIRKRRRSFASQADARDNFSSKPPMSGFDPEVLELYLSHGLEADAGGGVSLVCSPDTEASIYEGEPTSYTWEMLSEVTAPTLVMGGGLRHPHNGCEFEMISHQLPRGECLEMPGLGHFGPFEDPTGVGMEIAGGLTGSR